MGYKHVILYEDRRGESPVLEEIRSLTSSERRKVLGYIALLREEGEELRRPVADYVGDKLYELRPGPYRALYFFFMKENVIILHLFRKVTSSLPDRERRIAISRMLDYLQRCRER